MKLAVMILESILLLGVFGETLFKVALLFTQFLNGKTAVLVFYSKINNLPCVLCGFVHYCLLLNSKEQEIVLFFCLFFFKP
ncbi:hypothetical protein VIBNIFTn2_120234 [Vibrio nigripulchritudo FTn2]|nr:hypothetical protein VIBNIFTn2_120234 [Vibrio nigripulchritudo FTn2]